MRKKAALFLVIGLLSLQSVDCYSQCAMCQRVAETGHANDNSTAKGLNKGILYLLAIPYILGGIGLFAWYKNKDKN